MSAPAHPTPFPPHLDVLTEFVLEQANLPRVRDVRDALAVGAPFRAQLPIAIYARRNGRYVRVRSTFEEIQWEKLMAEDFVDLGETL